MGRKRLKGELINLRNYRHSYYSLKYNLILVTKDNKEFNYGKYRYRKRK